MEDQKVPRGELFSRLYVERGAPTQDSRSFRNRLAGYFEANHYRDNGAIGQYLQQERGIAVNRMGAYYDVLGFLRDGAIQEVLDSITLIWRALNSKYPGAPRTYTNPSADAWHGFVARALREENLEYTLDSACGVHYDVDKEFERNRVSVLRGTGSPRYAGVRAAFESAHSYLDAQPPDTKAAIRSMFEAVEILARLMDPPSKNLNQFQVRNKLKALVRAATSDPIERECRDKMLEGVAEWVDAIHPYRHGQGVPDPVAPSLELAVYVLSSGAAVLRLLLSVDAATAP